MEIINKIKGWAGALAEVGSRVVNAQLWILNFLFFAFCNYFSNSQTWLILHASESVVQLQICIFKVKIE